MNIDEIKMEFIHFMDSKHEGLLFPKNYFGCMIAVFVEQKPTTQERIEEITGYSRATISQMLKLIQINFYLTKIKKPKIRKKFYVFDNTPQEFMANYLEMIIDSFSEKIDFLQPIIEKVEPYINKHNRFLSFRNFLLTFYEMSDKYLKLFLETKEILRSLIITSQLNYPLESDKALLEKPENRKLLQNLLDSPSLQDNSSKLPKLSDELALIYNQLKNHFYQKFRENLTTGESQLQQARTIIGTEMLLENQPITQAEIENATHFARSLISDVLNLLLDWKMIRLIKKPSDRKKYYMMDHSWDNRLISRLQVNKKNALEVKAKINELIKKAQLLKRNDETKSFISFLKILSDSYEQFKRYYELLEVIYLKKRLIEIKSKKEE